MPFNFFIDTLSLGDMIFLGFVIFSIVSLLFSLKDDSIIGIIFIGIILFAVIYFNKVHEGVYTVRPVQINNKLIGKKVKGIPEISFVMGDKYIIFDKKRYTQIANRDLYSLYSNVYESDENNKNKIVITQLGTITYFDQNIKIRLEIIDM